MVLAASALFFFACSNDDEIDNWNGEIRLCTTTLLQTRAAQNIQADQFDADESVDIFINEDSDWPSYAYPQPIEYTADGSGGLTTIYEKPKYPSSGNGVIIYGIYPSGVALSVDGNYDFSVKADQALDADYKASDLMIGTPAENPVYRQAGAVALTFKHMLAKININVEIGTGLTVDSLENATIKILGTLPKTTFNIQTGEFSEAFDDDAAAAFEITAATLSANTMSCSAIIIPQELEPTSEFIQITLVSGTTLTYQFPENANISFSPGLVYIYNLTANRYEITATTQIYPWDTGAEVEGEATN